MSPVEIIAKKRDGKKLTKDEISYFITSFLKGEVKDYQMSALLMAILIKGMDFEETGWLTEVMLYSGESISFPEPRKLYVDKHSTGGVGDKVSLILAPWVAACGAKVPMLSGRGLGHTGGTLDKLETIPGYKTKLSLKEFKDGVARIGCIISGQTPEIAPADKAMYALRDVTSTVESVPLICGSILSKKFAAGPNGLVFDVKCGNGAFMKNEESAKELALNLIGVCKAMNRSVTALLTDMNQPLGCASGNILEVKESVDALKGNFSPDLYAVTLELGIEMLILTGISPDRNAAQSILEDKLKDGSAWSKFQEMVSYQKGNLAIFEIADKMPKAPFISPLKSQSSGFIEGFETEKIGRLIVDMGGGRKTKDDTIDPLIGFIFEKKIGDEIKAGETLVEIHARTKVQADGAALRMKELVQIGPVRPEAPKLIKMRLS
jgi:pyrimidine-nucleoside phosphorylase